MKTFRRLAVILASLLLASFLNAQNPAATPNPQPPSVLFHNARIFDGVKQEVWGQADVLVQGNRIAKSPVVPSNPIPILGSSTGPDAHSCPASSMPIRISCWPRCPCKAAMVADLAYINLVAAKEAQATLLAASPPFATWEGLSSGSSAPSTRVSTPARVSILPAP